VTRRERVAFLLEHFLDVLGGVRDRGWEVSEALAEGG
jgi:hypothetical protein